MLKRKRQRLFESNSSRLKDFILDNIFESEWVFLLSSTLWCSVFPLSVLLSLRSAQTSRTCCSSGGFSGCSQWNPSSPFYFLLCFGWWFVSFYFTCCLSFSRPGTCAFLFPRLSVFRNPFSGKCPFQCFVCLDKLVKIKTLRAFLLSTSLCAKTESEQEKKTIFYFVLTFSVYWELIHFGCSFWSNTIVHHAISRFKKKCISWT